MLKLFSFRRFNSQVKKISVQQQYKLQTKNLLNDSTDTSYYYKIDKYIKDNVFQMTTATISDFMCKIAQKRIVLNDETIVYISQALDKRSDNITEYDISRLMYSLNTFSIRNNIHLNMIKSIHNKLVIVDKNKLKLNEITISNMMYGIRKLSSSHPEVCDMITTISNLLQRSSAQLTPWVISNCVLGLQNLSSSDPAVRQLIQIINTKLETCESNVILSDKEIGSVMLGLQNCSSSDFEVSRLLVSVTRLVNQAIHARQTTAESSSVTLQYRTTANCLFGMQNLSTSDPNVASLLSAIRYYLVLHGHRNQPPIQGYQLAQCLYGLQNMSIDTVEVKQVLRYLIDISSSEISWKMSGKEIGMALYGLRSMKATSALQMCGELQGVLELMVNVIKRAESNTFDVQSLGMSYFGLQNLSNEFQCVNDLISVLNEKLVYYIHNNNNNNSNKCSNNCVLISNIMYGIQHMRNNCNEIISLLEIITSLISNTNTNIPSTTMTPDDYDMKHVTMMMLGLQHMTNNNNELNVILKCIHNIILHKSNSIDITEQMLGVCLIGVKSMGDADVVRKLIADIVHLSQQRHMHSSTFVSSAICSLQSKSCEYSEIQDLIKHVIDILTNNPKLHFTKTQEIVNMMYGLKVLQVYSNSKYDKYVIHPLLITLASRLPNRINDLTSEDWKNILVGMCGVRWEDQGANELFAWAMNNFKLSHVELTSDDFTSVMIAYAGRQNSIQTKEFLSQMIQQLNMLDCALTSTQISHIVQSLWNTNPSNSNGAKTLLECILVHMDKHNIQISDISDVSNVAFGILKLLSVQDETAINVLEKCIRSMELSDTTSNHSGKDESGTLSLTSSLLGVYQMLTIAHSYTHNNNSSNSQNDKMCNYLHSNMSNAREWATTVYNAEQLPLKHPLLTEVTSDLAQLFVNKPFIRVETGCYVHGFPSDLVITEELPSATNTYNIELDISTNPLDNKMSDVKLSNAMGLKMARDNYLSREHGVKIRRIILDSRIPNNNVEWSKEHIEDCKNEVMSEIKLLHIGESHTCCDVELSNSQSPSSI